MPQIDVAYLVRDMLFTSKIREVAKGLGLAAQGFPDPAALAQGARGAQVVIVDLRLPPALEALAAVTADPACAGVSLVGFIDHERTDLMDAARAHGCRHVLTKGQFAKELPRLLGAPASGPPSPPA